MSESVTITKQEVSVSDDNEVTLTLTVANESVGQIYRKVLADIGRNTQIKGFRRGKVPGDVIERKFGDTVRSEAVQALVQSSFEQAVEASEHKPMQLAAPHVHADEELDLDADYTFSVHYDTFPDVSLGTYRGLKLEELQVAPGEEDVGRELKAVQEQNAIVVDKAAPTSAIEGATPPNPGAELGDVITVDFAERDASERDAGADVASASAAAEGVAPEGGAAEGSAALAAHAAAQQQDGSGADSNPSDATRRDFVFEIGTGYNAYGIDDDVVGMLVGDSRTVTKEYAADYEYPELAARSIDLTITLKALKTKQLPEVDDELAQDISDRFETLDDLKADISARLGENATRLVRERVISELLDRVLAESTIALPRSMVQAELAGEWQELVARAGGDEARTRQALESDGRTPEQLFEEWRPRVERRLRLMLIVDKLAEAENIEVTDDDLDAEIETRAKDRNTDATTLKQQYENANMLRMLRTDVRNERLYDLLIDSVELKKGKKLGYLDLVQGNY